MNNLRLMQTYEKKQHRKRKAEWTGMYYWLKIALFSVLDKESEDSNNYIIASFILKNYKKLAGITLTEIANNCNVSKAAVSRFCRELGLLDYVDLQMLIRAQQGKTDNRKEIQPKEIKEIYCARIEEAEANVKMAMDNPLTEELISDLRSYKSVSIFGHMQASHIAYTLRDNLAVSDILGYCTISWVEQRRKLENMGPSDLIIIFSTSGDFFKRMDINMNAIEKLTKSRIYMITFDNEGNEEVKGIRKILLGKPGDAVYSNISMNLFSNYLSYRINSSVL